MRKAKNPGRVNKAKNVSSLRGVGGKIGRAIGKQITKAGALGMATGFLAGTAINLTRHRFTTVKPGFDEKINGQQFDFGRALGKYTVLYILIDLLLTVLPVVNLFDALISFGVVLPAGFIESAKGLENEEITRNIDWVTALDRALGQIEYDKWKEEVRSRGWSQMSVKRSDMQFWYDQEPSKMKDEDLLTEDVQKDYKSGKMSKELYDVIKKLMQGAGDLTDIRKLSEEDQKKLFEEYGSDKDYSWIIRDLLKELGIDVKKAVEDEYWRTGYGNFLARSREKVEYDMLGDIKYADQLFDAGPVSTGYAEVYLTAEEKFILYNWLTGNDEFLRNASEETKKKLKREGILEYEEGQDDAVIFRAGPAAANIAARNLVNENKFPEAKAALSSYMASRGMRGDLQKMREHEATVKRIAGDGKSGGSGEAQRAKYVYQVREAGWNWFKGDQRFETDKQLTHKDKEYEGVSLRAVVDPNTGKQYFLKNGGVIAADFFENPQNYRDLLPDGVYVNSSGQLFFGDPSSGSYQEAVNAYEERQELQQKGMDAYGKWRDMEDAAGVYVSKQTGASVAGGVKLNAKYVRAGKATISGGNMMKK